jgi:hypothetical protein
MPAPAKSESGQMAKAFPVPQSGPVSKPVSTPAQRPAAAEQPRRGRGLLWLAAAAAGLVGLCLLASVFGIPSLLKALNPGGVPGTTATPPPGAPPTEAIIVQESPPPRQKVDYFIDDFGQPDSGWDRREDDGSITDYEGGFYRIYIDKPSLFYWSNPNLEFTDVSLEVEASKSSGPDNNFFGLLCRYQDQYNFYMLAISAAMVFTASASTRRAVFLILVQNNGNSARPFTRGRPPM